MLALLQAHLCACHAWLLRQQGNRLRRKSLRPHTLHSPLATQHRTQSQSVGKPHWQPGCSSHIPCHSHLPPFPSPASQHGRPLQEQQQASRQHQQRLEKKPAQTIKACKPQKHSPFQNGACATEPKSRSWQHVRNKEHSTRPFMRNYCWKKTSEKSLNQATCTGCARSTQQAFALRAHANMRAFFIFKSSHKHDCSSLHNAEICQCQTAQLHEVIDSLGCCNLRTDGTRFVLTRACQSGRQPRCRT